MIKKYRNVLMFTLTFTSLIIFSGCSQLDVVGKEATTSFDKLTQAIPEKSSFDASTNYWTVKAPNGNALLLSSASDSTSLDAFIRINALPFLDAGLKPENLPANYIYNASTQTLTIGKDFGKQTYKPTDTLIGAFDQFVLNYRDAIGYHEKLDHYGIALGDGNMFEWAKDLTTNDKDLVFVLNPEPLIKAGVDQSKVKEWVFAQVEIKDNAKTKLVDKFLMPFQIQ